MKKVTMTDINYWITPKHTCVSGWFSFRLSQAYSFISTAHLFKSKTTKIIKSVKILFTSKVKMNQRKWNIMQISLNTVTSLMPEIDAPKQRPVDIAPHPEYKSSKLHSGLLDSLIWVDFSLTPFLSVARTLDPDSLESVEASLSIMAGAVLIRANHNQHKKIR